jgi:glycosyltransferase involved in cell wall biosynthesis
MRVALVMGAAREVPGGHRTQHRETLRALTALGVQAFDVPEDRLEPADFDLVHGFVVDIATLRRCRNVGVPTVLSPIYWSYRHTQALDGSLPRRNDIRRRVGLTGRLARAAWKDFVADGLRLAAVPHQTAMLLECADLLLPNARGEAEAIRGELGVSTPVRVVPNGVDPEAFQFAENPNRVGILYVGRIEPHKNQAGFIKAVRAAGLPGTIVGWPHPHHGAYVRECRRLAGGDIRFLVGVSDTELRTEFSNALVHALPSWYETTGLSSLEAAAMGCRIVTTARGHAAEYFSQEAWYCDPGRPASLRASMRAAHDAGPISRSLSDRVRRDFSWQRVAECTLAAYKSLLADRSGRRDRGRSEDGT